MGIEAIFNHSLTYTEYRKVVDKLVQEGMTTGNTQTPELVEFTKLNVQRMNRLDKTFHLTEEAVQTIQSIDEHILWLLVGDAWCGDSAQIMPVINKIAEAGNTYISLKIISRDSYPGLVETATHGSRAIPELLIIDPHTMEVVCTWGARPQPAQKIANRWKASNGTISHDEFEKELHSWYAKDKGVTTMNELLSLIKNCEKKLRNSFELEMSE